MSKSIITNSFQETQKQGELLAKELKGGEIICLEGELGAGKTTFTQGILKELQVKGPYISPTFLIMKNYPITKKQKFNIYHIDAYRVKSQDILSLGWKEISKDNNNILIIEWPERIKDILPQEVFWIKLKWIDDEKRVIQFF